MLASIFGSSPDIEVIGYFPDDNPLSIVYNGPRGNAINLKITNHAKNDISIDAISGAFREVGGKERHLANVSLHGVGAEARLLAERFLLLFM